MKAAGEGAVVVWGVTQIGTSLCLSASLLTDSQSPKGFTEPDP